MMNSLAIVINNDKESIAPELDCQNHGREPKPQNRCIMYWRRAAKLSCQAIVSFRRGVYCVCLGVSYILAFLSLVACYVGIFMLAAWLIFGRPSSVEQWSSSPANPIAGMPDYPVNFMAWLVVLIVGFFISCSIVQCCCCRQS